MDLERVGRGAPGALIMMSDVDIARLASENDATMWMRSYLKCEFCGQICPIRACNATFKFDSQPRSHTAMP